MSWSPAAAPGQATPGFASGEPIEILNDNKAFAEALADAFAARGLTARSVAPEAAGARTRILTIGLTGADALALHTAALTQAQAFAATAGNAGGTLILLQAAGIASAAPSLASAWQGGLSGLGKTARLEWSGVCVRVLDLSETGANTADRVVNELLAGGAIAEVALSPQARFEPVLASWSAPPARALSGVLAVTGGARGVTADCVVELARRTRATFALIGRSALLDWPDTIPADADLPALRTLLARQSAGALRPGVIDAQARALLAAREVGQTLSRIQEAGGQALYLCADIADPGALSAALAGVRQSHGAFAGLVHGAGVLADKRITDKTPEQLARVFAPKVAGLQNMLASLQPQELRHIALFSSAAARYGNAGQSDYAMANEILNRTARALKAEDPGRTVVSFNWGPWDGGMVDPALKAHFAGLGIGLIPKADGAALFADAMLAGPTAPVELAVGSALGHG